MQVDGIKALVSEALTGQPGVKAVEDYQVPRSEGLVDEVVHCEDGRAFYLRIVRTSSPTGAPEPGAVRDPGVEIVVER